MSNIIDSIQLSGVTYTLSAETSGGGVPESAFTAYTAATDERISQDEEVTAAALNILNESLSGKQDTLSAGTNITISGNVISAEGGGKAIEAGRGISVTTGETADTVSFDLPISAGTGFNTLLFQGGKQLSGSAQRAVAFGQAQIKSSAHNSAAFGTSYAEAQNAFAEGSVCHAAGSASHAEGLQTTAYTQASHAEGKFTEAKNDYEHASGQYNVSSSASTTFGDSGNTLFSVGNGTSTSARHNAFEIRQNGDIYLSSGGTDIKLQDHLGGSSITVDTELNSGSTNPVENRVIYNKIDEIEEVTAAGLNALNDKITPTVELTQAQYDALVSAGTVSADTYYIITDAQAGDLSQYWTSAQTQSAITQSTSGKQETLVSGTNIKTINNESILGSGNITIQGGSDINVVQTTGTSTTDVMSQDAVTTQLNNKANKSAAFGGYTFGSSSDSDYIQYKNVNNINIGNNIYYPKINGKGILTTNNIYARINYNFSLVETSAITTSVTSSSTDVQVPSAKAVYDAIQEGGGGGTVDQTIISGSTNAVAGGAVYNKIDEIEQVTAAGLNAVNDKFDGLKLKKLTQVEYDALSGSTDANTLYVIVN